MSAADAESLRFLSSIYELVSWLVAVGVLMEGCEIFVRRRAHRRAHRTLSLWNKNRFIGPLQPFIEPQTPDWAHNVGDIGFLILIAALIIEPICHAKIEAITGRENRRLTEQLDSTTRQAAILNDRAASNELRVAELQPRIQPIASVSASVTLHVRAWEQFGTPRIPKQVTGSPLTIIIKNAPSGGAAVRGFGLFLSFDSDNELRPITEAVMRRDNFDISSSFHPVSLSFDMPYTRSRYGGTIIGRPVSLIDDIDEIMLTLFNGPIDADVSGSVTVVFNGTARTFGVPNQKFNSTIRISGLAITNLPPKQ